jgi:CRP-like cAMP-binding protein
MIKNSEQIKLFHGEALFRTGQQAAHFYLVKTGSIYILDETGLIVLKQFFPGELFGIPEVLAQGQWANTALANGNTVLMRFDSSNLFQSLDQMSEAQSEFIRHIASLA